MFHWKPCAKIHYPKDCPPDAVYLFSAGRIGWQGSGNGWHVQCNKRWVDHPKQSAQWTLWNLLGIEFAFESIEIYWNLLKSIGIYWNLLKSIGIYFGIYWILKGPRICWNLLEVSFQRFRTLLDGWTDLAEASGCPHKLRSWLLQGPRQQTALLCHPVI